MVRLMLTLTPIVCVAAAMAVSEVLTTYTAPLVREGVVAAVSSATKKDKSSRTSETLEPVVGIKNNASQFAVLLPITFVLCIFAWHCTWVTVWSYSSPSVVLSSQDRQGNMFIIVPFPAF